MAMPELPLFERTGDIPAVKICGFRDGRNLAEVAALGVDAVGLNFWPGSKRFVPVDEAARWAADLPTQVVRVGVFVEPTEAEVRQTVESGAIQVAQLHGNESAALVRSLLENGIPVIKAVGIKHPDDLRHAATLGTPWVLADAFAPGVFGGTGRLLDSDLVLQAWQQAPGLKLGLSGGLTPDNVAAAIACVRPALVDVASGVESEPGIKDLAAVKAFLDAVRSVPPPSEEGERSS